MSDLVEIWYVSSQRLCNFHCEYCVSIEDYAKSNRYDWKREEDRDDFEAIIRWLGTRPFRVGLRLGTLGEPFTSDAFLRQAGWLTTQPNVEFVELLTNGSLLKSRLGRLAEYGDISKVALWVTHHHTEISIERFIDNARYAQDELGCFVVVNGLLFPDNQAVLAELKDAADAAGLRFNLDLGYDPGTAVGAHDDVSSMVPVMRDDRWLADAARLGVRSDVLDVNLVGLRGIGGRPCSAGHDYVYIGIDGDVYPCSRYYVLGSGRLGNVLEPGFELPRRAERWAPCGATAGCCNKEDFLHLQMADTIDRRRVPSLGWVGS